MASLSPRAAVLSASALKTPEPTEAADKNVARVEAPSEASTADGDEERTASGAEGEQQAAAEELSGRDVVEAALEELNRIVAQACAKEVKTSTDELERVLARAMEVSEELDPEDEIFTELAEQATAASDLLALRRKAARAARKVLAAIPAEERWWESTFEQPQRPPATSGRAVAFHPDVEDIGNAPALPTPEADGELLLETSAADAACEPSPLEPSPREPSPREPSLCEPSPSEPCPCDSPADAPPGDWEPEQQAEREDEGRGRECTSCSAFHAFFAMLQWQRVTA